MNPSTRHLLRNIYLLCAVSAITCAGLVAVFGWRHLQQHQHEAEQIHAHLHALEHVVAMQSALLNVTQQVAFDADSLATNAQQLTAELTNEPAEQALGDEFKNAWQSWVATTRQDAETASNRDEAWAALCHSLERIRQYHAHQLEYPHHQHAGAAGSVAHLWFGAVLLIGGGWGVVWLVTAIVRSQRQLLQAQETLERRVAARTSEIARQNERLSEEVAQRQRLQQEILTIASEEQRRIAGWLHDDLGQRLTGLSLGVKTLERELANSDQSRGTQTLTDLAGQVRSTSETLRMIVRGLYPTTMTTPELMVALETLAAEVQERAHCACRVELEDVPNLLDDAANVQLYGILREALTNAIRHAGATVVRIRLAQENGQLVATITDDGCGFESDHASEQGVGFKLMRYRADILRATLEVQSAPDAGTRVHVRVPNTTPVA